MSVFANDSKLLRKLRDEDDSKMLKEDLNDKRMENKRESGGQ